MTIVRHGRQMDLAFGGHPAGAFEFRRASTPRPGRRSLPSALDLAPKRLARARLGGAGGGLQAVFDGIIGKLDRFSRYSTAELAREHRAARDGIWRHRHPRRHRGCGRARLLGDGGEPEPSQRIESRRHHHPHRQRAGSRRELETGYPAAARTGRLHSDADAAPRLGRTPRGHAWPRPIVPETVVDQRRGNAADIRLYSFNQDTTRSLSQAIRRARKEVGKELSGIILDLRDNPGGLLDQAVSVSDVFMTGGRIVSTHGRHPAEPAVLRRLIRRSRRWAAGRSSGQRQLRLRLRDRRRGAPGQWPRRGGRAAILTARAPCRR